MNPKKFIFSALAVCCFYSASASALGDDTCSESRPVTSVYSIEAGRQNSLSTYLSPMNYSGSYLALSGSWKKALPANPEHLLMAFDGRIGGARMLNPYGNAYMIGIGGGFGWSMLYRTRVAGFQLAGGGGVGFDGGAQYLLRNGNNPVNAIANASLSLRASVSRHITIGRLPILFSDEVSLPSLSAFFCPEYGESYYEIYLGNRKGLAHCGWWGNNFRITNLLSADLDFGRTAMRVGYRFEAYTSWANNLSTRIFTHSFVLGVIPGGIGLKKRGPETAAARIYAIY